MLSPRLALASNLTARTRASYERAFDPYVSLAQCGKLPGVRRVGPGHYSATGPVAKISPTEAFAHYNKPATITAP